MPPLTVHGHRATVREVVTHIDTSTKFTSAWQDCLVVHTRAIVTTPLEFLHKWTPSHLVYTIATLVSEETRRLPYNVSDQV